MSSHVWFFKHFYLISILPSVILNPMKTYIVTIYHQDKENPDTLVGTVEEAGAAAKKVFLTFEGLGKVRAAPEKSK